MLKCPKCLTSSTRAEWDKMTSDMTKGDYMPLSAGYGRLVVGYYCPCCYEFSSGKRLKEYNK